MSEGENKRSEMDSSNAILEKLKLSNLELVKITPPREILMSIDSDSKCPIEFCKKKLTKSHSFDIHIREHLGMTGQHTKKQSEHDKDSSKASMLKDAFHGKDVAVKFYCPEFKCIYSSDAKERDFSKLKYLKQHYQKVHAPKVFECSSCKKRFSTQAILDSHTRVCGITFTCTCTKSYNSLEALQTHARRKSHPIEVEKYKIKRDKKLKEEKTERTQITQKDLGPKCTAIFTPLLPKKPELDFRLVDLSMFGSKKVTMDFGTQTASYGKKSDGKRSFECQTEHVPSDRADFRIKRKKSAETQTGRVKVRVSTDTQTASVIKRQRSNRKKPPSAEAETQSEALKATEKRVSIGEKSSTPFASFQVPPEISTQTPRSLQFRDLFSFDEEVHCETQTESNLFLPIDEFDLQIQGHLSEESNFVHNETQTFLNSIDFQSSPELSLPSYPLQPFFHDTSFLETRDNETQTASFDLDHYLNQFALI